MYCSEQVKMAKSIIKKELVDIEKIKRFTETELQKLSNSPLPFCYQVGSDTIIVGASHKVKKINDKCWEVCCNGSHIFDFFSRKDAIFYCIAIHQKQHRLANEIKETDKVLGILDFDAILYRYRYNEAIRNNDFWNKELFSTKYTDVMLKIQQTKKQLQKSLKSINNINNKV